MKPARLHPPLQLEFAPGARRIPVASQLLLLVCAAALGLSLWALAHSLGALAHQSAQLAALRSPPAKAAVASAKPQRRDPLELAQVQFVRKTARNMATPWTELLAALEATPASVALLSVEPSASKRSVTLTAEAATAAQMLAYLRTLQADTRLHDVLLLSHQLQAQAPGTPLRFQLEGHWGGTP